MPTVSAALLAAVLTAVPFPSVPSASFLRAAPLPDGANELRHDWAVDGVVTGVALGLWVLLDGPLQPLLAPAQCRWCDRLPDGTDALNPVDAWGRGARWGLEQQSTAHMLSNVDEVVVLLAVAGVDTYLARDAGALQAVPVDMLVTVETVLLSQLLNEAVKAIAGRERPFVHVLPDDQKLLTHDPADNNVSFYSGHTNMAFALVSAAGTVAHLRGYRNSWLIWAVGLPLAASVGYLRMAADKHYLTDVLAGALIGTAVGWALPTLLHGRTGELLRGTSSSLAVAPGQVALTVRF